MLPISFFLLALLQPPEPYTPPAPVPNVLTYNDGNVEVDAEINAYENLMENKPINGSIFITQDFAAEIDSGSFRIGDKPLKALQVSSKQISVDSPMRVSIYSFTLDGMPAGLHNLPPISVKVGSKTYQSLPLSIEIGKSN